MTFEQATLDASQEARLQQSWWQRSPWWMKVLVLPLIAGFAGMAMLLTALRLTPLPDESAADSTQLDAEDGQSLAQWTLRGTRSDQTPLGSIPATLQTATLAVEDAQFFHHHAFSPWSVARALWVDARHRKIVEGGSTITQQLAKNLYLRQDRTVTRKLREALFAIQLELHESKKTILERYLNAIYYGHGAYGVGAAAELYFNKPVAHLNLAECALLAGLPKGPSLYSPLVNWQAAKARQKFVLNRMVKAGYIDQGQAAAALRTSIHINTTHPSPARASYFTTVAIREMERRYHLTTDDLYRGHLSVTTTLDPVLQQAAERALATTLPHQGNLQAALVALDPQTGAIRALVGGRDFTTSPYNRVFAERQPGSAFKPILYSAALMHGWTPARQVDSEKTTFLFDAFKLYTVHDYGDFYAERPLTLREAIARSDNVYAVTTNLAVGPDEVIRLARKMGISSPLRPYPSLALGVFPTSPIQLASAYAVLANGGWRVHPYTVAEVRAARAHEVWQTQVDRTRVLPTQLSFQMSDLLTSVLQPNGTAYPVHAYLHDLAAAKTGTTSTDAWMVGYTPRLVCAVWVGYDDNHPLTLSEAHLAGPIWAKFMGTAQQRLPGDWFTAPSGLERRVIDPVTAKLATDTCRSTETDYFTPGTAPTEACPLHAPTAHSTPAPRGPFSWLRRWW